MERFDQALRHCQVAIKVCIEMRFRPELALTRLQLAELLLEHNQKRKKKPCIILISPSRNSVR